MEGISSSYPIYNVSTLEGESSSSYETRSETSSNQGSLYEQVTITNCLLVGIILFIGIFFGAFCMAHLFNRIRKD